MELNRWIESVGGTGQAGRLSLEAARVVSSLLGEKTRTVQSWYRHERLPCFSSAANILLKSKGAVDWNGIYAPYARKLLAVSNHDAA